MENKTDLLCNTQNSNLHLVVEGKLWSLYHSSVPFLPAEELLCRALDSASKIHYVCGELSLERSVERMYFRFAYDHLLSSKRREEERFSVKSGLFWQNHEMITLILSQNVMYFLSTENVF